MLKWRLMASTLSIPLMALVLAAAATLLPDNPYQRFQLLEGTIYNTTRWVYERIHFDPTPIDVAIVGHSRTVVGLRPSRIEEKLAEAGKPAHVVNMSLIGAGRNSEWVYIEELLKTKKPKVIIVAISEEPYPWGHDTFRYIAPAADIWDEAFQGLHDAKKNLIYLPFRQIELFAASLFPEEFHLPAKFDSVRYAATRYDYTTSHMSIDQGWIEMSKPVPRATLIKQAREHRDSFEHRSKLPGVVRAITDADDRVYVDKIVQAAAKHGAKVLFVFIPAFDGPTEIKNRAFYEERGAVDSGVELRDRDTLYENWSHLNSAGSVVESDRIAAKLVTLLP